MLNSTTYRTSALFAEFLPSLLVAVTIVPLFAPWARADIVGFGNFGNFTINQADGGAAPTVAPGAIELTNNAAGESRSIFYNVPQAIAKFAASFTYQVIGTPSGDGFGATFVLQNSAAGEHAVVGNFLGNIALLGYAGDFNPFGASSAAVSLEYGSVSPASSSTALYHHGAVGGGSSPTNPVNLFSGNPIEVTLTYDGSLLHEQLFDPATSASFETFRVANFPLTVAGSTALVGFTANSGNGTASQRFSNFRFSVPEPSTIVLLLTGIAALSAGRMRCRRP